MKITAVRGWDPLREDRFFEIGRDDDEDLSGALGCEHRCKNPACDLREALKAGFPRVAAHLLASATESALLDAVARAHRFNATADQGETAFAVEWQAWLRYWEEAETSGRLWNCPSCSAWSWGSSSCGSCSCDRPVP